MKIYVTSAITVIAMLASALMTADAQTAPPSLAKFKDPSLPPEARARELIANMTLEEKASQLGHTAPAIARRARMCGRSSGTRSHRRILNREVVKHAKKMM